MNTEKYLLDTNVVSELRKKQHSSPRLRNWFKNVNASSLFLSVVTIAEIQHGIELISKRDKIQAELLIQWKSRLQNSYQNLDHLLSLDPDTAQQWGKLQSLRPLPAMDAWLAATAIVHDLTIVTRNEKDFARLPIKLLNPWTD
ncbi:MAG: type II toxin-antitoxin system VapC family toxin [Verrucomicrobiota bacterium]